MKRLIIVLIVLNLLGISKLWANPIDAQQAVQIAQEFFSSNGLRATSKDFSIAYVAPNLDKSSSALRGAKRETENLYYVINRGQNEGYIVVAGDERVTPVFAYSFEGNLDAGDIQNHSSIQYMFDEYKRQVKWAMKNLAKGTKQNSFRAGRVFKDINIQQKPLLSLHKDRTTARKTTISFGQKWPFNMYCPNIKLYGKTYPTVSGCVATAIATVMRWHEWPKRAKGKISYKWRGEDLSVDLDKKGAYNWNVMPEAVNTLGFNRASNHTCTDEEADQIGRLLRDIGYATNMNYDASINGGSGTQLLFMKKPFVENFDYDPKVDWICKIDYSSEDDWWKEITDEMDNYGPIIYAGISQGGGHCFNLDGYTQISQYSNTSYKYETYNYVHVDWGWNSKENGWYLLSVLKPGSEGVGGGSGGYKYAQQMIRYLKPRGSETTTTTKPNKKPIVIVEPEVTPEPEPEYKPEPKPEVNDAVRLKLKRMLSPIVVTEGENPSTTIWLSNLANQDYYGLVQLYMAKREQSVYDRYDYDTRVDEANLLLIAEGYATLHGSYDAELNVHTTLPAQAEAGDYDLYFAYHSKAGQKMYLSTNERGSAKPVKIGELTILAKDRANYTYSRGVVVDKVQFFQSGKQTAGASAVVKYYDISGKFTSRIYLKPLESNTNLKLKVALLDYTTEKIIDKKSIEGYISVSEGAKRYLDVVFDMNGLYQNWYKLAVLYWDDNNKKWLTYDENMSQVCIDYTISYTEQAFANPFTKRLNQAKTYEIKHEVQEIGSASATNELASPINLNSFSSEASSLRLYPTVTTGNINIETKTPQTIKIYDMLGRLVSSQKIKAGKHTISISGLAKGTYIIRIAGTSFRVSHI